MKILLALLLAGGQSIPGGTMYHEGWTDFNKNGRMDVYENPAAPLQERIEDLLGQMTLEEKTCQMVTLYGYRRVLQDQLPTPLWKKRLWKDGIGAIDVREPDGSVHDSYRIDYMRDHIKAMKAAVEEDGVDLIGYTPWGWIDIVSAGTGEMRKRYGFVYVDMDDDGNGDMSRSRKDSFYYMQKVYKSNGEDLD